MGRPEHLIAEHRNETSFVGLVCIVASASDKTANVAPAIARLLPELGNEGQFVVADRWWP